MDAASHDISSESMLCYRCALLNFKELHSNGYMQAGLGNLKFGYHLNKIRTKLQRQDTHQLNVFISENMIKMDAAVCHIACDFGGQSEERIKPLRAKENSKLKQQFASNYYIKNGNISLHTFSN